VAGGGGTAVGDLAFDVEDAGVGGFDVLAELGDELADGVEDAFARLWDLGWGWFECRDSTHPTPGSKSLSLGTPARVRQRRDRWGTRRFRLVGEVEGELREIAGGRRTGFRASGGAGGAEVEETRNSLVAVAAGHALESK
jgi:hypothetical protein